MWVERYTLSPGGVCATSRVRENRSACKQSIVVNCPPPLMLIFESRFTPRKPCLYIHGLPFTAYYFNQWCTNPLLKKQQRSRLSPSVPTIFVPKQAWARAPPHTPLLRQDSIFEEGI